MTTAWDGDQYQRGIEERAAATDNPHGEADLVMTFGPATVLDAGCGTGRVAAELFRRGVEVVGVDVDPSMITTARSLHPDLTFVQADLAGLDLGRTFDVVVLAGNVPIFTPPGTHAALVAGCATHVAPGGALAVGFQLGRGYDLAALDRHGAAAGLTLEQRWATWDRQPWLDDADYAVSVFRR